MELIIKNWHICYRINFLKCFSIKKMSLSNEMQEKEKKRKRKSPVKLNISWTAFNLLRITFLSIYLFLSDTLEIYTYTLKRDRRAIHRWKTQKRSEFEFCRMWPSQEMTQESASRCNISFFFFLLSFRNQ